MTPDSSGDKEAQAQFSSAEEGDSSSDKETQVSAFIEEVKEFGLSSEESNEEAYYARAGVDVE